jgi:hypothetical protein
MEGLTLMERLMSTEGLISMEGMRVRKWKRKEFSEKQEGMITTSSLDLLTGG